MVFKATRMLQDHQGVRTTKGEEKRTWVTQTLTVWGKEEESAKEIEKLQLIKKTSKSLELWKPSLESICAESPSNTMTKN